MTAKLHHLEEATGARPTYPGAKLLGNNKAFYRDPW